MYNDENLRDLFDIHTDLAVENKERFDKDDVEISGVKISEKYNKSSQIKLTKVEIVTEQGERIMRKPIGTYITLEAEDMCASGWDSNRMNKVSKALASELIEILPIETKKDVEKLSVLVVGLGNREVTPDALGPYVISKLDVNRHIYMQSKAQTKVKGISAMIPGVMAQSGMESAEMVKGIVNEIKPDVVIAIDALAARSTKRLNATIQLADTGIHPGSGIGNRRRGLNSETLGVPVIAIGIPTVIDAATIVSDTMDAIINVMASSSTKERQGMSKVLEEFSEGEKRQLIRELLEPQIGSMFVTPKDIDENIRTMAEIVAKGINMVFEGSLY